MFPNPLFTGRSCGGERERTSDGDRDDREDREEDDDEAERRGTTIRWCRFAPLAATQPRCCRTARLR
jgi:hypothetical protein